MKVKELLSDESKWIQGTFVRDNNNVNLTMKYGMWGGIRSEEACKFCLGGAIMRCYGTNDYENYYVKVMDHLKLTSSSDLYAWNDRVSFEDVKKLVEELDI